jgi:single-strand DNA-binding protein
MSKRFAINTVVQIGGLTRDPELRSLAEGGSVCKLRLAVDGMGPGGESGYIDVDVFGKQAEPCAQYLSKGREVAVKGRLAWREWEAADGSSRQGHHIVADSVQFLGGGSGEPSHEGDGSQVVADEEPVAA